MASKVEQAAADILKDELVSLEEWIQKQQETLEAEIKKIEGAYEENRRSLLSTGAFN